MNLQASRGEATRIALKRFFKRRGHEKAASSVAQSASLQVCFSPILHFQVSFTRRAGELVIHEGDKGAFKNCILIK